jgi:hypothetical protein
MSPTDIPSKLKPSHDSKLRKQLEAAIAAIDEGASSLPVVGRKPSHRGRNVILGVLAVSLAGTAVALTVSKGVRNSVFGSAKALGDEINGSDDESAGAA